MTGSLPPLTRRVALGRGVLCAALGLGLGLLSGLGAVGCAHDPTPTHVTVSEIDSAAEGRPMRYALYTPPGWDGQTPLPLVVLLHGGGDDERVLLEHPEVAAQLDAWIDADRLPPFLMVAPDGEFGFWVNWHDGSHAYEDWVLKDVIQDVSARFPVADGRANRHVIGPSMGGAGTLFFALRHRDMFASATVVSAPIFDADMTVKFLKRARAFGIPTRKVWGPVDEAAIARDNPFAQFASREDLRGLRLSVVVGSKDRRFVKGLSTQFHEHLATHEVPHDWIVYDGKHRWVDWAPVLPVALCRQLRGEDCELPPDPTYRLETVR